MPLQLHVFTSIGDAGHTIRNDVLSSVLTPPVSGHQDPYHVGNHESKSNQPVTPMRYIEKHKNEIIQTITSMVDPGVFSHRTVAKRGFGIPNKLGGH